MDQLTGRVDQLAVTQQNTQANLDQLAALIVRFVESAEADRAVIREIQTEVRGLQTENRHIWEYLMRRNRNGNGDGPQP